MTLLSAALLTASMFGWQAWHLYDSYQAVEQRDAGECPTRAVEASYSAGERLDYLSREIEHSLFLLGPTASSGPLPELGVRFDGTDAELVAALETASRLSTGEVLNAVNAMSAARAPLVTHMHAVMDHVVDGEPELALSIVGGQGFVDARQNYTEALEGMWHASRRHLVAQLEQERRTEVLSVGVALGLFSLALGAWALFIRRIRHGQRLLREEERQRKQAVAELLHAQKMEALGRMAGGIAHDFNNLVTAIWGSATSATEQLAPDHPALPSIRRIEEAAIQANGVVRGLLTFSRRSESAHVPIELGAVVDVTARMLQSTLPASIELLVDRPAEHVLWFVADATQIQQALTNLALNAVKAMPGGGRLRIRTWLSSESPTGEPRVFVEVADEGEGMDDEVLSHIFEPFYTTRTPGGGTGLGMSIVHGIVTEHEGRVRIESKPGEGTSVIIDFPVGEPPTGQPATPETGIAAGLMGGEVALIVEDHKGVREVVADTLRVTGFTVIQSATGTAFLDLFDHHRDTVRLVVADVDIPPPNGVECVRIIHMQKPDVPAIVITGTPAPGLESDLDGEAVVLRKPFTMATLSQLAADLVGSRAVPR